MKLFWQSSELLIAFCKLQQRNVSPKRIPTNDTALEVHGPVRFLAALSPAKGLNLWTLAFTMGRKQFTDCRELGSADALTANVTKSLSWYGWSLTWTHSVCGRPAAGVHASLLVLVLVKLQVQSWAKKCKITNSTGFWKMCVLSGFPTQRLSSCVSSGFH